jgi:WD40 repeat protein
VAFSPDGKWFATGGEDGKVIIWNVANLAKEVVLNQPGKVIAVAFSIDGRLLASASHESEPNKGRILLLSVGDWRKTREFSATVPNYGVLRFKPRTNHLVSSGRQTWDVETGRELPSDLPYRVNWMATAPDNRGIIMMGSGNNVQYFNLTDHKVTEYPGVHQDHGRAAAFSPGGKYLATGSDDVVLWNAATMTKLARLKYDSIVWNVSFSPDGHWLVSTHGDGAIMIWDVEDRNQVASLNGHSGPVGAVAWASNGKQIASASEDRSVVIWNAETGQKESVLLGANSRLTGVAISKDAELISTSSFEREIAIWERGQKSSVYDAGRTTYCVAFSPDKRWIATTTAVFDVSDGHLIVDFYRIGPNGRGQMYGVAFSDDGRWLVGVSPYGFLSLFETATWRLVNKIPIDSQLTTVSFSPDSKHFVTGEDEGVVRLWEVDPLRQVALVGRHSSRVKSVAFSPNGREVCSAGDDQTIALWDVNARRLITKIGTHARPVLAVAFSPDGKRIASGEHDSSVRVYSRHRTLWGWQMN